jgi:hypothetical protein
LPNERATLRQTVPSGTIRFFRNFGGDSFTKKRAAATSLGDAPRIVPGHQSRFLFDQGETNMGTPQNPETTSTPESTTGPAASPTAPPTVTTIDTPSNRLRAMLERAKVAEEEKLRNEELARRQAISNAD